MPPPGVVLHSLRALARNLAGAETDKEIQAVVDQWRKISCVSTGHTSDVTFHLRDRRMTATRKQIQDAIKLDADIMREQQETNVREAKEALRDCQEKFAEIHDLIEQKAPAAKRVKRERD